MIKRYIDFLGLQETRNLLEANEKPLIPSIRVNTIKIPSQKLRNRLVRKGFILEPIEWISYGFNVKNEAYNLGSLHEFLQGYFYIQNIASMLPPIILCPNKEETVIDMCAAPGGKATHMAQLMENRGKLILIDKNKSRIPSLEINLRRMGVLNSIVLNIDAVNLTRFNIKADKILLDAPCTGEGLIRQDPSRKRSKTMDDLKKMSSVQENLLIAGLKSLKPNGQLIYSTCSIAPEENEMVIDRVLKHTSHFYINKISTQYGFNGFTKINGMSLNEDLQHSQRLYPHVHNTIGFYICLIIRKG